MSLDGRRVDAIFLSHDTEAIHTGLAWMITSSSVLTIAKDAVYDVMLVTGDSKVHLRDISVNVNKTSASGIVYVQFSEAPTTTANGITLTPYNANRNYATSPTFSAYQGPTVTSIGTPFYTYIVHTDWETYVAPSYTTPFELVLKPNTKYLMRLTNTLLQSLQATYFIFVTEEQ